MGLSEFIVILVGLAITVGIGLVIVLLVALPGLRNEGKLRESAHGQRFRFPHQWTGYDDSVYGFFGEDDETSHLATREQAAVTAMREHNYVLRPQPRRHGAPKLSSLRPRTRHWKVPASGEGFATALKILFS